MKRFTDSEIDITGQKHDVTQVASDIQMLLGNMPDIENCAEPEILSNEDGQVTFRAILSTNHSLGFQSCLKDVSHYHYFADLFFLN